MTGAFDKKNHKRGNSISEDGATDSALWRLSLVLKEIAESTIDRESSISDKPKPPSNRSDRKAVKSKKEVDGDDNNTVMS